MKVQDLCELLNQMSNRWPRITTSMVLQRTAISDKELTGVTSIEHGAGPQFEFSTPNFGTKTVNFVDLISCLCEKGTPTNAFVLFDLYCPAIFYEIGPDGKTNFFHNGR